jgi:hypothetical protein
MSKAFGIFGLLAGVIGLTVGGIAYASIPDGNNVIHGCYRTNGGDLRVIDDMSERCRNSETGLNWNTRGDVGPPGPSGSSHAYHAASAVQVVEETLTTIVRLDVSAGNYVVSGKTTLFSDPVGASCLLVAGVSELDRTVWTNDNTETISLQGTTQLASAATLSIQCASVSKSEARNIQLIAMAVDTIN